MMLCAVPSMLGSGMSMHGMKAALTDRCLLYRIREDELHCDAGAGHLRITRQVRWKLRDGG